MLSNLPKLTAPVIVAFSFLLTQTTDGFAQQTHTVLVPKAAPQYVVEARFISCPAQIDANDPSNFLKDFLEQLDPTQIRIVGGRSTLVPGSMTDQQPAGHRIGGNDPRVNDHDSRANDQNPSIEKDSDEFGTNGASLTALLNDKQVFELINQAKARQDVNISQAPTLNVYADQEAFVHDGAERPFVTGVSAIKDSSGKTTGYQPEIRLFREGTSLNVVVTPENNSIQVRAQAEVSEFTGVTELAIRNPLNSAPDQKIRIQMPEMKSHVTSISDLVPNGSTLMVVSEIRKQKNRGESKVPLLGDAPLVKGLFRFNVVAERPTRYAWLLTVKEVPQ